MILLHGSVPLQALTAVMRPARSQTLRLGGGGGSLGMAYKRRLLRCCRRPYSARLGSCNRSRMCLAARM